MSNSGFHFAGVVNASGGEINIAYFSQVREYLLEIFTQYPHMALFISLLVSILVAVLGLVPSVFVTAANIFFFGFWQGTLISLAGEAAGAIVAFLLYRAGFKKAAQSSLAKYPRIGRLIDARGARAFGLIITLRLIPYVPSGLVTFAAAIGKVSVWIFFAASTLGKIPSLLIEAYTVAQIVAFGWQGKLILILSAAALLVWIVRSGKNKQSGSE